eukprot:Polyplicarium_translucidae@DN5404_c0_g1_i1.p3
MQGVQPVQYHTADDSLDGMRISNDEGDLGDVFPSRKWRRREENARAREEEVAAFPMSPLNIGESAVERTTPTEVSLVVAPGPPCERPTDASRNSSDEVTSPSDAGDDDAFPSGSGLGARQAQLPRPR